MCGHVISRECDPGPSHLNMKRFTLYGAALCALMLAVPLAVNGEQPTPIDPKADKILKQMGEFLAKAKHISFNSHAIADQMTPDGQKVQYAKNQKVLLSRPNKLAVDV